MRLLVLIPLLAGCPPVCPEPAAANGTWDVFATVLEQQGGDDPAFPSYHSPANGPSTWVVTWGAEDVGPVAVSIDGQPMQATGLWSRDACGTFALDIEGVYNGPTGSRHTFDAAADLVVWDDQLDGTWDWSEVWVARNGETSGAFTADGQLEATRTAD